MPVPVATSSTRSACLAPTAPTKACRQRGSCPSDRTVATHSYDSAIPAKSRRAWRERAETADSMTSVVPPPVLGGFDGANGETGESNAQLWAWPTFAPSALHTRVSADWIGPALIQSGG